MKLACISSLACQAVLLGACFTCNYSPHEVTALAMLLTECLSSLEPSLRISMEPKGEMARRSQAQEQAVIWVSAFLETNDAASGNLIKRHLLLNPLMQLIVTQSCSCK